VAVLGGEEAKRGSGCRRKVGSSGLEEHLHRPRPSCQPSGPCRDNYFCARMDQ
jgi:hypothetical protein